MLNSYPQIPHDKANVPMQGLPAPKVAFATYAAENATASSVISVTANTTIIEIGAQGTAAVMKWIPVTSTNPSVFSSVSGANFDHVIPKDTYRRFAMPIESMYQAPSSMVGANVQNGLYQRVAIKSIGVGSVLLTEY